MIFYALSKTINYLFGTFFQIIIIVKSAFFLLKSNHFLSNSFKQNSSNSNNSLMRPKLSDHSHPMN
jgi:hypothetical protein